MTISKTNAFFIIILVISIAIILIQYSNITTVKGQNEIKASVQSGNAVLEKSNAYLNK